MPSAPQKRAWAIGRSLLTQTTLVLSRPAASSLNFRTLAAHTPVSTLGKMLSTVRVPSSRLTSEKSGASRENAGAGEPTAGSSPAVVTGLPPR